MEASIKWMESKGGLDLVDPRPVSPRLHKFLFKPFVRYAAAAVGGAAATTVMDDAVGGSLIAVLSLALTSVAEARQEGRYAKDKRASIARRVVYVAEHRMKRRSDP
jgi:hypothetical protein